MRPAFAEVHSAVVVAAVTLALSCAAYSLASFHLSPAPVYSESSYSVYGTPSFLHLRINATAPTSAVELRVDNASSLSGILALTASGYTHSNSICAVDSTTFFAVITASGTLSFSGSGTTWIDGIETASAMVQSGLHEVVIADGYGCSLGLPGGGQVSGPSAAVSPIPVESLDPRSFLFLIPYNSPGHGLTLVFDGGSESLAF